jgi:hypothetical protein
MDGGLALDGGDGGVGFPAIDIVRGVSPIAFAWRGADSASGAFMTSALRELEPGMQLVVLRPDATQPGGTSVGLLDPTNVAIPDGLVEVGPATNVLPDIPGPM